MADMKIEVDSKAAIQAISEGLESFQRTMAFQVFRAITLLEAAIKQNIRKNAGLKVRSGALLNSVSRTKKVTITSNNVVGEVGSEGVPYNLIHEKGGTIFPVNKKFLAIPAPENRRRDGTPKMTTTELRNLHGPAEKSFIMGGVIFHAKIAGPKGARFTKLTPMFFLKKSVTIPARPYVQPAIAAKQDEILKNFGLFISAQFAPKKEG